MVITLVSSILSYMVSRLVGMNSQLSEIFLSSDTGLDSTNLKTVHSHYHP